MSGDRSNLDFNSHKRQICVSGRRSWQRASGGLFARSSFATTKVFVTFCLQKVREIIFNLLLDDECRVTEVVLISIRTNVKYVGAWGGRGSGPAVGFLRGEALPRLRFLLLFASKK